MSTCGDSWDDEYSVIGDKGEVGFIDYEDDKSVCSYNPIEEGPVSVSVPFPFVNGKPQSIFVGETVADSITLKNSTDEPLDLWTKIYASTPENSFTLSLIRPPSKNSQGNMSQGFIESFTLEDRMLQPGDSLTIWLSCKPQTIGLHTTIVHFDVGDDRVERVVFLLADDKISQSLAPQRAYSRGMKKKKKQFVADKFVAGSRPAQGRSQAFKNRLPRYDIPKDIRELVESKQIPDEVTRGLTRGNYASFFKTLLIMEEIQLEEDMRAYDMENVKMKRKGQNLSLQVPGLAERRPSLVHGDYIFAKLAFDDASETTPPYQGYIHRVEADEVYLMFAAEFHLRHRDENLYNVQFTYNRINMRRQYQAVEAAEKLALDFLFPSECPENRVIETTPLVPISSTLNEEQMCSIEMILGCKGGPPYVIYGPPGTGKTMTLVEAILQLYTTKERHRILVCAPSNSAADNILEKLLNEKAVQLKENEIFRLNAATRSYEEINPDYIRFCFFDEFVFKCPPLNALSCYKIIISTYMSVSLLFAEGVKRGHFSHIFLDEAGQASEPENLISIANLCKRDTVVVLAGDPMQLGPVIYSKEAKSCGLGKSYLERLFEFESYFNGDENYVTKLVRNYRCHPEILYLPSTLFYRGELIPCKEQTDSFLNSVNFLPNKQFPVLFFGIQGCDEREGNNPSWFNRIEASKVIEFTRSLLASGNLSEEEIGIITPYRQQVLKLKQAFENLDMFDIKVGSVEQFQGQERKVIIISTVRSTIKHNEFDNNHCLGFLSNERRFNVSITRAISLLVIVGNPHILAKDYYWSKLIWHCSKNNSYQGCDLPPRQEFDDSFPEHEDYVNPEENIPQYTADAEWGEDSFPSEIRDPITTKDEWSDGWQ
ncbi:hypothetical protein SLEP1_g49837 [Rubroshorea leprosula]|uniref:RNA helicase n=1 Tax=Rubroshorea leprosula TaxID=152421 RepID=A0AAV5LY83_9ROSI|nr:hypothetical protein SLEP1_g49837 [Rubroshorea leprosula]